jgi:hypothetical protein
MAKQYVFIDESGRLEFRHINARYFVLSSVVTSNPSELDSILNTNFMREKTEFKASKASVKERSYVLGKLRKKTVWFMQR